MIQSRSTSRAFMTHAALGWLALTSANPAAAIRVAQPQDSDTLEWHSNYGEALALSKQTGRPLLVEFRCAP